MPSVTSLQQEKKKSCSTLVHIASQQRNVERLHPPLQPKRLDVDDCSDDVAIAIFTNGLRDSDLVRSLYKKHPGSFVDIMTRAKIYMLAN